MCRSACWNPSSPEQSFSRRSFFGSSWWQAHEDTCPTANLDPVTPFPTETLHRSQLKENPLPNNKIMPFFFFSRPFNWPILSPQASLLLMSTFESLIYPIQTPFPSWVDLNSWTIPHRPPFLLVMSTFKNPNYPIQSPSFAIPPIILTSFSVEDLSLWR